MTSPSQFLTGLAALAAALSALRAQTPDRDHLAKNVFAQMPWQELGPVASGGRIVDLAVHPTKPQVFWVAAASGGIWKTTNNGYSFTPQFQDAYSISIGDLAVAPSNGDVLYVGTGEGNNQRSSYWGNGVHKSTDGGATWSHVGLDGTDHIGRIAIHPQNADIVYVAALGALYSANDARGLYRTKDGGVHWERVKHLGENTGFVDVVFDPQDPTTIFAASYERRRRAWHFTEGGEGSRIYRSTDGGETFAQLASGLPGGVLGRIGLDVFAGDGRTVYASIENLNPVTSEPAATTTPSGERDPREPRDAAAEEEPIGEAEFEAARLGEVSAEVLADPVARADLERFAAEAQDPQREPRARTVGGELYRSDDRGETWTKTNTTAVGGEPMYYYGQVRVDPQDKDTVYVLGVPVYKTTDGGKTWTPSRGRGGRGGGAFHGNLHVDHHALWIDPRDGRHCLLGNDGGLAVTYDGGAAWDHLTVLPILQCYTIAVDLAVPYHVYVGLQDNGTWGFPVQAAVSNGLRSTDAYRVNGGDGFFAQVDPTDSNIVYSESQFGGMSRLDLRTGQNRGIKPRAAKGAQALRFNWSTPILLSPHAPDTVYTGSQFLHRSRDRGDHWTAISPDLTTNDADKKKGNVPHCTITTIAESQKREGMLWVGTDDGRVWLSKDGGQRWTDLDDRFPPEVRGLWVSRVEASPHDADCAFVSFTGYREDRRSPFLFRTDDAGETWLAIEHDLPMEPINVIRQHPRNPHVLLVGTEMGAYVSVDDGAQWFALGSGLPRVAVHDLVVHPREPHVLVGTHGRGVFALDASALEVLDEGRLQQSFAALPPTDGVMLGRSFSPGNTGARDWSARSPFTTPTFRYVLAQDDKGPVAIEVKDAAGTVVWKGEGDAKAGYHEVPWQDARRGGRGGFGGNFQGFGGRGARPTGPRPGEFAVTLTLGENSATQTFRVVDRRPQGSLLGAIAGEEEVVISEEEEEEEAEEAEQAAERGTVIR